MVLLSIGLNPHVLGRQLTHFAPVTVFNEGRRARDDATKSAKRIDLKVIMAEVGSNPLAFEFTSSIFSENRDA